jgi:uncharacterized DUF497 family protein
VWRAHGRLQAVATIRVGEFEWDEAKGASNTRKHGVSFVEATTVFLDELAVPFEESEHPGRLILLGESQLGRVLLVVFAELTDRGIIRIISARRGNRRERKAYAEHD